MSGRRSRLNVSETRRLELLLEVPCGPAEGMRCIRPPISDPFDIECVERPNGLQVWLRLAPGLLDRERAFVDVRAGVHAG